MGQLFNRKKHPPNPTESFPLLRTYKMTSSLLVKAHSPHFSKAFTSKNMTAAAAGKWAIHLTKPTQYIETDSRNNVMKNKLSRIETRILVQFLQDNESLLSPDSDSEQFNPSSTHPS
ncbi:hypothetical protein AVEN_14090-1 [Araneus ventricosus]|uniref:Uncharacterized protein n=1 Tax=Araneus ventricosus TaxID=182803 RepID=A0A4Y2FWM5_ARAVE|nr:hypothetical protein AVEN_14090-1 [Araneus ventricosus]